MKERFDPADINTVVNALRDYMQRCQEIADVLRDKKTLSLAEREFVKELYETLKEDLKQISRYGTVSGERRPLNRAEQCFFERPIRKASIALRPKTNSHPLSSDWRGAVFAAEGELSYSLHRLEDALQEE